MIILHFELSHHYRLSRRYADTFKLVTRPVVARDRVVNGLKQLSCHVLGTRVTLLAEVIACAIGHFRNFQNSVTLDRVIWHTVVYHSSTVTYMDWIEQCFTSPPTQYRLYGRRALPTYRISFFCGQRTDAFIFVCFLARLGGVRSSRHSTG